MYCDILRLSEFLLKKLLTYLLTYIPYSFSVLLTAKPTAIGLAKHIVSLCFIAIILRLLSTVMILLTVPPVGISTESNLNVISSIFRLDALALSVIATATWLAGWVAVTLRYCIKTAKHIRKLFRPSESPITLVFCDPCADTKFQGEPLQRGR